ncbi:hypothetical protein [Citreimonas salinaria]|uniref:Uncharacterized protein n=1 Tax=Citreimonas salinaria TaxID=321339 RepID=A0A1H3HUV9_9RHOB|nr:hypothetical protein [Citreimonas salinaria]SDY18544.1 hypothetical protein SAMN05444340_104146 [Citreimonas salinaria]
MKATLAPLLAPLAIAVGLALLPASARADCFAAYKAKQDDPLRLHFGVLKLDGDCPAPDVATDAARARLDAAGWTLLDVVGLSETEPGDDRKADAGQFYLRY